MCFAKVPDHVRLPDLIAVVADQLHALAAAGKGIEDAVGDEIALGGARARRLLVSLQGLDHIVQTLSELSLFMDSVRHMARDDVLVPVSGSLRGVRLRELANALCGKLQEQESKGLHDAGEVDLF
jgi:hypothetical protein